jgi:hypothetical protein
MGDGRLLHPDRTRIALEIIATPTRRRPTDEECRREREPEDQHATPIHVFLPPLGCRSPQRGLRPQPNLFVLALVLVVVLSGALDDEDDDEGEK